MCISVFAVVRNEGRVLVGVPKWSTKWNSEWLPSVSKNTGRELDEESSASRLPSSYIYVGEHPDDALRRMLRGQLGITKFAFPNPRVFSYLEPSQWYPGNKHWDVAFAYEVTTSQNPRRLPHWKELGFLEFQEIRKRNFGWNNDFVRDVIES